MLGFDLLAAVAFYSSIKVVVLALRAHPPAVRKIELRGCCIRDVWFIIKSWRLLLIKSYWLLVASGGRLILLTIFQNLARITLVHINILLLGPCKIYVILFRMILEHILLHAVLFHQRRKNGLLTTILILILWSESIMTVKSLSIILNVFSSIWF